MKNKIYLSLNSLLFLGLLLPACAFEQSKISSQSTKENQNVSITHEQMIISGKIVQVMESWPLQLSVETSSGSYDVQLLEDTKITRQGQEVKPGELSPNMPVKIEGQLSKSNSNAFTASNIEIQALPN
ncbi:MAG: hypothetical protein HC836_04495 [Richelia sp. RM2_1_2]|nr:hypothetical protein [Richelia sp. SM1_7_0]NJN10487.1 hypothetical protein [Richelia sp. RM1_1_1]NJO26401.1 hypothetical protein [Richelia sp. SL_2_1]NJO57645.1 hypothetical protein [Richelia sp. RM2_1_2]